jgi:hypothetical protein
MVFRRHGGVAKSSTKVTTLPPPFAKATEDKPVSRLALTPKSSFSLARLFFNGLLWHDRVKAVEAGWGVRGVGGRLRSSV